MLVDAYTLSIHGPNAYCAVCDVHFKNAVQESLHIHCSQHSRVIITRSLLHFREMIWRLKVFASNHKSLLMFYEVLCQIKCGLRLIPSLWHRATSQQISPACSYCLVDTVGKKPVSCWHRFTLKYLRLFTENRPLLSLVQWLCVIGPVCC